MIVGKDPCSMEATDVTGGFSSGIRGACCTVPGTIFGALAATFGPGGCTCSVAGRLTAVGGIFVLTGSWRGFIGADCGGLVPFLVGWLGSWLAGAWDSVSGGFPEGFSGGFLEGFSEACSEAFSEALSGAFSGRLSVGLVCSLCGGANLGDGGLFPEAG